MVNLLVRNLLIINIGNDKITICSTIRYRNYLITLAFDIILIIISYYQVFV